MTSWKKYTKSIIIHDKLFLSNDINKINLDFFPTWEKENFLFIKEWINDLDYLKVNTSGSTGIPKSLKIDKTVFVFSALNTGTFFKLKNNNKALLCLPANYIAGKMMIVRAFVLGLNLHWQKPSSCPEINEKYDFVAMTPMQIESVLKKNKTSVNNIKTLILGGAPLNEYIKSNIQNIDTKIFETYGMTETVSHIALKRVNGFSENNYFKVLSGIEIETDNRNCLIATSKGLNIDNLISNDIIKIKNETQFKWLGRADNVINSGGIKLIPEQIEAKLKPYISNEFFIFGIKDSLLTEVPAILIEGEKTINLSLLHKYLHRYEIPKKIFLLSDFSRTDSGKIKRQESIKKIIQ